MLFIDFIAAKCTNYKQMAELRILRQKFQQFDRCMVCPLQVIQEQDQWMVLPGKYSNEFPENSKKPVFGFLRTISFRLSLTSMVFLCQVRR